MQQIFQRPRKPVQLPDYQHVPFPQVLQGPVKLWPVPAATRGFLFEDALHPARRSALTWAAVSWASAFETRA
jgi:hypothetical protein